MPAINQPAAAKKARPAGRTGGAGAFTGGQKGAFAVLAVLVGPALVKKFYDKPAAEKVDLSAYNIVAHYDKPAIEKLDSTLRIEFCAS